MRGIRRLVCSKAFALGVLCAYASVAAVFLTLGRATLFSGDDTNDLHLREAARTPLLISIVDDDDDVKPGEGTLSESLFIGDADEPKSSEKWLVANLIGTTRLVSAMEESHSVANVVDTSTAKELLDNNTNATTRPIRVVRESDPTIAIAVKSTSAIAAEPTPGKTRPSEDLNTTKVPVRVFEDSVVEPTLPKELQTDMTVTIEIRNGVKTWCTKENSANQHGLDCRRRIPTVLGIGMERCGTTALSFFLRMHPDMVHAKPKDVYYWNQNPDQSLDWYRAHMPISSKYQVTMEYTPSYILSHDVPLRIKETLPDMKFIVMIRDPVERAMSSYLYMRHSRRPGYLKYMPPPPGAPTNPFLGSSFEKTILKQNGDVFEDNAVIENALYESHLRRWFEVFPREQFLIIDEGVFRNDPVPILQKVEDFIGISKFFNKYYLYFDQDRGVFCQRVPQKHCSKRSVRNVHPPIEKKVLKKLKDHYHPYNIRLEKLLNQTFPWT